MVPCIGSYVDVDVSYVDLCCFSKKFVKIFHLKNCEWVGRLFADQTNAMVPNFLKRIVLCYSL